MGLIKKPNGELVPDKRANGARLKLDVGDWIKIMSVIAIIILSVGKIQWTANANSNTLILCQTEIKNNQQMSRDNRKDVENLTKLVEEIKTDVKEILRRR